MSDKPNLPVEFMNLSMMMFEGHQFIYHYEPGPQALIDSDPHRAMLVSVALEALAEKMQAALTELLGQDRAAELYMYAQSTVEQFQTNAVDIQARLDAGQEAYKAEAAAKRQAELLDQAKGVFNSRKPPSIEEEG